MTITEKSSFESFKSSFQGDIVTPQHSDYQASIARWSKLAERPAGVVVLPKSDKDVAQAIQWAVKEKVEITVKGGCHNPSGASSSDGGMVIDLSRFMRGCVCEPEKKVVVVQGGATWAEVDTESMKYGLATVAGTVNHTGVGGLTVGGGYGVITGEVGLTIDQLVEATVVTADGSILLCNSDQNSDLLWAIRGGGINFGVVTTFTLKCHPQKERVWAGFLIFPPDKFLPLMEACDKLDNEGVSPKAMFLGAVGRTPMAGVAPVSILFYNGSEEEGKEYFKSILELGPIADMTAEKPYTEVNAQMNAMVTPGKNVYMMGSIMANPAPKIAQQLWDTVNEAVKEHPEFSPIVGFEYMSLNKVQSFADDSAAFNCRRHRNNVLIQMVWEGNDELAGEAKRWAKRIGSIIDKGQGENEIAYGNYESDMSLGASRVKKLYGSNYPRLQELKAKYDPNVVFGKWFPIEPLKN